jgi:diphosphomevalonate decarboxylase
LGDYSATARYNLPYMGSHLPILPVTAWSGTNIALVKYWGKRPGALNIPAAGSLSLTLAGLGTTTTVQFLDRPAAHGDQLTLNGLPMDAKAAAKSSRFIDLVRAKSKLDRAARVESINTVPTAAGLASSASGFAALALAATKAAGLNLTATELSILARQGSGSAARSIFGGFALMSAGTASDGTDAFARSLQLPESWKISLVIALTTKGAKSIGSTEAMQQTAATSPYYQAWINSVPTDLKDAELAVAEHNLAGLGQVAERSCLRMHACAMAAAPGILYWNPVTLGAIQAVMTLRSEGLAAYFTIDAGPHVKVLCSADDASKVQQALAQVPGVIETIVAQPGVGAHLVAPMPEGSL